MPNYTISTKDPDLCCDMLELRTEIDILDYQIIKLLNHRSKYIDRAVALKRVENLPARTHDRVALVMAKVRSSAEQEGLDPELVERIWHELIEWSIAREEEHLSVA
ncbi:MAG: chorismate mutase [Pseudomonadota bacterium]